MQSLVNLRNIFLTEPEKALSPLEAFIAFSAKEALFKMIFPLAQEFFGFETAAVKAIDDQAVTLTLNDSVGCFAKDSSFRAFFGFHQDHVVTVCMLA